MTGGWDTSLSNYRGQQPFKVTLQPVPTLTNLEITLQPMPIYVL